jgi:hypothetical protein
MRRGEGNGGEKRIEMAGMGQGRREEDKGGERQR